MVNLFFVEFFKKEKVFSFNFLNIEKLIAKKKKEKKDAG